MIEMKLIQETEENREKALLDFTGLPYEYIELFNTCLPAENEYPYSMTDEGLMQWVEAWRNKPRETAKDSVVRYCANNKNHATVFDDLHISRLNDRYIRKYLHDLDENVLIALYAYLVYLLDDRMLKTPNNSIKIVEDYVKEMGINGKA